MDAILLAAGFGKRLRPLTNRVPKCMVSIGGITLVDIWIYFLIKNNFKNIIINTHWLHKKVERHLKNHKFKNYIKISYEKKILGTARTIKKNLKFLKSKNNILIAHADNLAIFNFKNFLKSHQRKDKKLFASILAFRTDTPETCGIMRINNKKILKEFHEKKKENFGNLANGAIYLMDKKAIDLIKKNTNKNNNDLSKNIIPQFIDRANIYETTGYIRDIGNLKSLAIANKYVMKKKLLKNLLNL